MSTLLGGTVVETLSQTLLTHYSRVDTDGEAVRALWLPAVLWGLLQAGDGGLRDNVATYALPPLLQLDQGALAGLLRAILPEEGAAAAATNAQARSELPCGDVSRIQGRSLSVLQKKTGACAVYSHAISEQLSIV